MGRRDLFGPSLHSLNSQLNSMGSFNFGTDSRTRRRSRIVALMNTKNRTRSEAGALAWFTGKHAEEIVNEILRYYLLEYRNLKYGPDGVIRTPWGDVYVEIKSTLKPSSAKTQVERAFSRPERPLIVILVVWGKGAWIYESPERRWRFSRKSLLRVLRKLGVIE